MRILGLKEFGIEDEELGEFEEVVIRATLHLKAPALRALIPYPPKERLQMIAEHLQKAAASLRKRYRFLEFVPRNEKTPWICDVTCKGKVLSRVSKARSVDRVQVIEIEGVERSEEEDQETHWFAVRGEVAIQVEGQTRGLQRVEDRIVVVEAESPEDAVARLETEWKEYAEPYLNGEGELVRWHLEKVVDVFWLFENEFDPTGTEVWSSFRWRRMKKQYEWHPHTAVSSKKRE